MEPRILLVDDERNVLEGYRRHLRKRFDITLAEGGPPAMELLQCKGPFAVVVCDMQMPTVSGLQVLASVADSHPHTVRIMLTGNADQRTAVDAVNEGRIFRFLNKPCPPDTLAQTLEAGLRQYELRRAEHDLLSKTLSGSVSLMTEVLSLANPLAFGRAAQVRTLTKQVCADLAITNAWEVEIAAMLSHIGCIAVPPEVLEKYFAGSPLAPEEQVMLDAHPRNGGELVRKIPRLERVADLISRQATFGVCDEDSQRGAAFAAGRRVLRTVLQYDQLASRVGVHEAIATMQHEELDDIDTRIVQALASAVCDRHEITTCTVADLKTGMIAESHIVASDGSILIAKGQEINEVTLRRLRAFADSAKGVREPIQVRCVGNVQGKDKATQQPSVALTA
ncbi:MAG: response regulator [Planctomycetales bacterium]|nr:response regulator [Planctomycetales bacterium]